MAGGREGRGEAGEGRSQVARDYLTWLEAPRERRSWEGGN